MKKEFKNLIGCFSYFTIIPFWKVVNIDNIEMNKILRYFPLIGWLVGAVSGAVILLCNMILPIELSVLFGMVTSLFLTGAIHEDGLADVCDGFGGGYGKKKILMIMKDSLIGVYGVISLVLILMIKFVAISEISFDILLPIIIIAHTTSRCVTVTYIHTHKYARDETTSKTADLLKNSNKWDLIFTLIFGILPFLLLPENLIVIFMSLTIPMYISKIILGRYFNSKIGGYTGDCLGATQQICEIIFYIGVIITLNCIK